MTCGGSKGFAVFVEHLQEATADLGAGYPRDPQAIVRAGSGVEWSGVEWSGVQTPRDDYQPRVCHQRPLLLDVGS